MIGGLAGGAVVNIIINGVDKFSKPLKDMSTQLTSMGKVVTGFGIAGALAFGKAISVASDFEETASKFATVFQDVGDASESVAQDLSKNFGLSELAAKRLLSSTGDLLTGFNFTADAALDISEEVNKLAVDLASFTNAQGGAEAVSNALTKALLGERESLKTYGIAILDADVNARVLANGQSELTGEALRQAKAIATLQLATEQSKNAVGDFARTQDSFANQSRIMKARIEDVAVTLGQALLPAATKVISVISSLVDKFSNLSPETQKWVGIIGGLTVAVLLIVGPLLILAGTVLPLLSAGIGAVTAVSLPWLLIILAVIAAVAAAILIFKNWDKITGFLKKSFASFMGVLEDFKLTSLIVWDNVKLGFIKMINGLISFYSKFINAYLTGINLIIKGLNKVPGISIPIIPKLDISNLQFDTGKLESNISELTLRREKLREQKSGVTVNINSVQGTDANDLSDSLQKKLRTVVTN